MKFFFISILFLSKSFSQTIFYFENFDSIQTPNLPQNWETSFNRSISGDFKTSTSISNSSPNCIIDSNSTIEQFLQFPILNSTNIFFDSLVFFERRSSSFNSDVLLKCIVDDSDTILVSDTLKNLGNTNYNRRVFFLPEFLNNKFQILFFFHILGNGSGGNSSTFRIDNILIRRKVLHDAKLKNISFVPKFPNVNDSLNIILNIENITQNAIQNLKVEIFEDKNFDSLIQFDEIIDSTFLLKLIDSVEIIFTKKNLHQGNFRVIGKISEDENVTNNFFYNETYISTPQNSIVINEIMFKPQSPEPEWIEIKNNFYDYINLKNWKISDKNISSKHFITKNNFYLQKDSFAIVVKDSESFFEIHPQLISSQNIFITSSFPSLNNDSDNVVIFDYNDITIDSIAYKSIWGNINGSSLERVFSDSLTNVSLNWGSSITTSGSSPLEVNSVTPRNNDIKILEVKTYPEVIYPNTSLLLYVIIQNVGLNEVTNFRVKYFYDSDSDSIGEESEFIGEKIYVGNMVYRDTTSFSLTFESLISGSNFFIVKVEMLNDENILNNFFVKEIRTSIEKQSIIINEVMYAPINDEEEWIEFYNRTDDTIDCSNFKIRDATNSYSEIERINFFLFPKEYFIISRDTNNFFTIYPNVNGKIVQVENFPSLNNGGDETIISDENGNIIDSLNYKSSYGGTNGSSLERVFSDSLTNDSLNWGSCKIFPTPFSKNSISPLNYDLEITSINHIKNENQITVIGTIKNIGKNIIQNFSVNFFDDENKDFLLENFELIHSEEINSTLNYRDSININYQWNINFSGSKNLFIKIKFPIDEDSTNNLKYKTIKFSYPKNSIIINEIMYEPNVGYAEFIELYNTTNDTIEISNWNIASYFIPSNSKIFPKKYFVIASDSSIFFQFQNISNDISILNTISLNLNNDEDEIVLKDDTNFSIDSVKYNSSWHNDDIVLTKGKSLERINPAINSTYEKNWNTSTNVFGGTPTFQNSIYTVSIPNTTSIIFSSNPFSPDGDGNEDFVVINFSVPTEIVKIRVRIFNIEGRLVNEIYNLQTITKGEIIWDGKNSDGNILPIGPYIILLEGIDENNTNIFTEKKLLVIAKKL